MGSYFSNFGVDFPDEDSFGRMMENAISNGRGLRTYPAGQAYINYEYGRIQLSFCIVERDDRNEIISVDMQGATLTEWEVRVSEPCAFGDGNNQSVRKVMVKRADIGKSMAVVNIINPDVLPSYAADEILTFQIAAFPEHIEYYPTREAFEDTIEPIQSDNELLDGQKLIQAPGVLFASGFLNNYGANISEDKKGQIDDDIMVFNATVKRVEKNRSGNDSWYYAITVDTQFGELEIIHSEDQVPEEERNFIVPGATIDCACHLVADPAMYEYAHGAVFDEENDLRLLRHVCSCGESYRLKGALTDDAVYVTHNGKDSYAGADNIVAWLTYMEEKGKPCNAYMATVTTSLDDRYNPGDRCVALIYEGEDFVYSLIFVTLDENGKITRMDNVSAQYITCELDDYEFMRIEDETEYDPDSAMKDSETMQLRRLLSEKIRNNRTMDAGMDLLVGKSHKEKERLAERMIPLIKSCDTQEEIENVFNQIRAEELVRAAHPVAAVTASTLFKQYYQSMLEITQGSTLAHNAEFELIPAMIALADFATYQSNKDRKETVRGLWMEIHRINRNIDDKLLVERSDLYGKAAEGNIAPRCEWCVGDMLAIGDSVASRCAAILGDILYNPSCADDYDNAPVMIQDIFQTTMFAHNVMQPLLKEFNEFYEKIITL